MMFHEDFQVGKEFSCRNRHWRCTDIGVRVVVAIRIDRVTIKGVNTDTDECWSRTMNGEQAEREGRLNGPPYSVEEVVIDENDFLSCKAYLVPMKDDADF